MLNRLKLLAVKFTDVTNSYPWISAILLNLLAVCVGLICGPGFQTNDDPGMIFAFSGKFIFDQPVAVTAFTSKIWGLLEVFLYQLTSNSGLEVHTILLLLVAFVSATSITAAIFSQPINQTMNRLISMFALAVIYLPYFHKMQFTMSSGIAVLAGTLLFMEIFRAGKYSKWGGLFLIIFGFLIRPENFWLLFPVIIISQLVYFFITEGKLIFRLLIKSVLVVVIVFFTGMLDKKLHTESESNFTAFNSFRSSINDYGLTFNSANKARTAHIEGISKEGLDMYAYWFYDDSLLFNSKVNYRELQEGFTLGSVFSKHRIYKNVSGSIDLLKDLFGKTTILLLGLILVVNIYYGNRKLILISLAAFILFFAVYFAIGIVFKPTAYRVAYVLFTAMLLYPIYYLQGLDTTSRPTLIHFGVLGYLVVSAAMLANDLRPQRHRTYVNFNVNTSDNSKLFFMLDVDIPFKNIHPFKISRTGNGNKLHTTGSFSVLPQAHRKSGSIAMKTITEEVLLNKGNLVFLLNDTAAKTWLGDYSRGFLNTYEKYLMKKYGVQIKAERNAKYDSENLLGYSITALKGSDK